MDYMGSRKLSASLRWRSYLLLQACIAVMLFPISEEASGKILNRFIEPNGVLRSLAFDPKRSRVYVGGRNAVHALLAKDLTEFGDVLLGPMDDSLDCPFDPRQSCPPGAERGYTENFNMSIFAFNQLGLLIKSKDAVEIKYLLLYDEDADTLISCGTLFYGSCRYVDLSTLTVNVQKYNFPTVPNDPTKSVVAFFVPKSRLNFGFGTAFVGASYSFLGLPAPQSNIHLLSARQASTMSFIPGTRSFADVLNQYKSTFPVEFVAGFEHNGFAYFLITRKENLSSGNTGTFLLRVCLNDASFRSLVELRIQCGVGGLGYGRLRAAVAAPVSQKLAADVFPGAPDRAGSAALYGLFTMDQVDTPAPRGASAVCMWRMKQIEEAAQRVTQQCFDGQGFKGPAYLVSPTPCVRKVVSIPMDYCGIHDMNYPVSDSSPIKQSYSAALTATTGMSLLVTVTNNMTIATVGTVEGNVVQAVLREKSSTLPSMYRETPLDKNGDSTSMYVRTLMNGPPDSDGLFPYVYALTESTVYQIQLFDCESLSTCDKCKVDPHCGWCASSNRCTRKSSCTQSVFWLNDRCPGMTNLGPRQVARDLYAGTKFAATLNFIPSRRSNIYCVMEDPRFTGPQGAGFVDKAVATVTSPYNQLDSVTLTCDYFRKIPLNGGVMVNMTLNITIDEAIWASDTISVFECNKLSSCGDCTRSKYPCSWCVERHACMPSRQDCSSPTGNKGSVIPDLDKCASIQTTDNKTQLVADGAALQGFSVTAFNIMRQYGDTLMCRFSLQGENKVVKSKAKYTTASNAVNQATVTCDPVTLSYSAQAAYEQVKFDLVWQNDLVLDNPNNVSLRVYKCRYLVSTCGQCLTLSAGHECGWCKMGSGGTCLGRGECQGGGVWMGPQEICSDPTITHIKPVGGPLKGGTLLTINGTNLGKTADELEIKVADIPCAVERNGYVPSQRVMCRTGSTVSEFKGPVIVNVNQRYITPTTPNATYHYKNPTIVHGSLTPKLGPKSGGTLTTIKGQHLNYGSSYSVSVNGLQSKIVKRTSEQITFLTPRVTLTGEAPITFKMDNLDEFSLKDRYRYVQDPTVIRTEPMISLFSGGSTLVVHGTGLDAVQSPRMIMHYEPGKNKTSACKVRSSSQLECPTPNLSDVGLKADQTNVPVGWIMDNVTSLVYIKIGNWVRTVTYFPDPDIYPFKTPYEYAEDRQMLEIKGSNMDQLKQFGELEVLVGGAQCWIDKKEVQDLLRCRMPEPDDEKEFNKQGLCNIVVVLGNYRREIGFVKYPKEKAKAALVLGLVFGLAVPLLIILALVILALFLRRRRLQKRRSAEKRKGLPSLLDMDVRRPGTERHTNPYREAGNKVTGGATGGSMDEIEPLKSKDNESQDFSILADDDKQYFQELLKRISSERVRSSANQVYIERERLEIGNLLGKGHFGCVYAATLRDEKLKNPHPVAVKTIEDQDLNTRMMEKFLEEGIIMKNFDHPHVLSLIGMCIGYKKEPMVILPFMAKGDLRSHVKDKKMDFTARQLILLTQQVAQGMAYLASLNYIHRDLAARNCMIDDRNVVKVADFGLSHQLYDKEYYSSKDPKSKLPIKWMALESLEEFVFTVKSDVWSYGVLMWELMTRGVTPYPDVEVFETRNYLASGRRLRKPKYCPDNVYEIMLSCWDASPEKRPTFSELVNKIEFLLNPPKSAPLTGHGGEQLYHNLAGAALYQEYLKPVNPDSSFANTDSSFYPEVNT